MPSLWPSISPRSVPLTMMPPAARASYTALILIATAWLLLGAVFFMRSELADEFVRSEAWRGMMRRVLLGASALLAFASFVPAISGFGRAKVRSCFAVFLGCAWCAIVGRLLLAS